MINPRQKGLLAGANFVMINVTSVPYRGFCSIYPGRAHGEESVTVQVQETVTLLKSLGRVPMDVGMVREYR
ncbi:MAG: hypothetical protein WC335_09445 [Candidatus Omnitrophota bacterium]|jgi:hypothetical protein